MASLREGKHQIICFAIIGCFAFLVDGSITLILNYYDATYIITNRIIAYIAAATFAWVLNRNLTFSTHEGKSSRVIQWLQYLASNTLGGAVNITVYYFVINLFTSKGAAIFSLVGIGAGSLSGMYLNYYINKKYVFSRI